MYANRLFCDLKETIMRPVLYVWKTMRMEKNWECSLVPMVTTTVYLFTFHLLEQINIIIGTKCNIWKIFIFEKSLDFLIYKYILVQRNGLYLLKMISAYHCKCIDPWLTKRKKTCPVCKRKVIPGANPDSDSESSDEEGPSTSERTPLLAGNNNRTRRSTFDNSGKINLFFTILKVDWNSFETLNKWNL